MDIAVVTGFQKTDSLPFFILLLSLSPFFLHDAMHPYIHTRHCTGFSSTCVVPPLCSVVVLTQPLLYHLLVLKPKAADLYSMFKLLWCLEVEQWPMVVLFTDLKITARSYFFFYSWKHLHQAGHYRPGIVHKLQYIFQTSHLDVHVRFLCLKQIPKWGLKGLFKDSRFQMSPQKMEIRKFLQSC